MTTKATKRTLSAQEKAFIVGAVQEVLEDPDFGLELTEEAKKRLEKERTSKQKTISLTEIKGKYY